MQRIKMILCYISMFVENAPITTLMLRRKLLFYSLFFLVCNPGHTQIFTAFGSTIKVTSGGILYANGGVVLSNSTLLSNQGDLTVTKNSTLGQAGTFEFETSSVVSGDGDYYVEQDWINSAQFNGDNGSVYLFGNTQQFITSNNSTITEFNRLVLQGNGSGVNRKKTLLTVDARVGISGELVINDRELETLDNDFIVLNPATNAVSNNQTFGNEGFVSSVGDGYLIRNVNQEASYLFPVGSSDAPARYRPVHLAPQNTNDNSFAVRMNNYDATTDGFLLSEHTDDIEVLNANFYHSIERLTGSSSANLSIAYLPSADSDWFGMAQWNNGDVQWKSILETQSGAFGNYSQITKSDWAFADPEHPYILSNIIDELEVPNVFTPNNDGDNDYFIVNSKGLTEFNMVIVNRWGNVVFESNDATQGWDGKYDSNPCTEGTYFYLINAKSNSKEYQKQGHLTLIGN